MYLYQQSINIQSASFHDVTKSYVETSRHLKCSATESQ